MHFLCGSNFVRSLMNAAGKGPVCAGVAPVSKVIMIHQCGKSILNNSYSVLLFLLVVMPAALAGGLEPTASERPRCRPGTRAPAEQPHFVRKRALLM